MNTADKRQNPSRICSFSGWWAGPVSFVHRLDPLVAVVPGPVPHGHKKSRPKAASLAGCAAA